MSMRRQQVVNSRSQMRREAAALKKQNRTVDEGRDGWGAFLSHVCNWVDERNGQETGPQALDEAILPNLDRNPL